MKKIQLRFEPFRHIRSDHKRNVVVLSGFGKLFDQLESRLFDIDPLRVEIEILISFCHLVI